jgi:hypothetical protein
MSTTRIRSRMITDRVLWQDDFLGHDLDPRYITSVVGAGAVRLRPTGTEGVDSPGPFGGLLQLVAPSPSEAVARCRLGADPPDDDWPTQIVPFNGAKKAIAETRCFVSGSLGDFWATIGFAGFDDPNNILGVLYCNGLGWFLQTAAGGVTTNVAVTGFNPDPYTFFKARIETSQTRVRLFIDDVLRATSTTNIPYSVGAPFEFQLWNVNDGGWSSVELAADYLKIEQER